MIHFNDYEKKLVIPRWLDYTKAARSHEFAFPREKPFVVNAITQRRLVDDFADFKSSPLPHKAADLMGAAFVVGEMSMARDLAKYVKGNIALQKPALALADSILGEAHRKLAPTDVSKRIAIDKMFLNEFPQNPFAWVERARCYTILGQFGKAEKCIRIAINLAPADRYVIRSAVRFFLHIDKVEEAWHYIKRSLETQFDPWLKATEVNVAEVMKKSVRKLKWLLSANTSPANIYQFSELIESFGMLELMNGNDHRAKKHFKLAWSNPSPNVVTHSEWIVREHFPSMIEIAEGNFGESLEANAWQHYSNLQIDQACVYAMEWALEEPYAKNAFGLASFIAFQRGKYESGITISKSGLKASPNEFGLQNNLCFGLLKLNNLPQAEIELAKMPRAETPADQVILSATKGLMEFKRGNISLGRSLYYEAIGKAKETGDLRLIVNAALNLAIVELETNSVEDEAEIEAVLKISEKMKTPDVVLTRQLLEQAYTEKKKAPLAFKEFRNPKILPPKF